MNEVRHECAGLTPGTHNCTAGEKLSLSQVTMEEAGLKSAEEVRGCRTGKGKFWGVSNQGCTLDSENCRGRVQKQQETLGGVGAVPAKAPHVGSCCPNCPQFL